MRMLALPLALAALAAPPTARAQQGQGEIIAVVYRLFDAMRAKDTAAVRATLHTSARVLGTGPNQQGQLQVEETPMDRFMQIVATAPGRLDEKIWDPEVRIDGDLATVWTQYVFHYDGNFSHCGVDAFQLARTADGWKIVQIADTRRNTGCPTPPPHAK